MTEDRLKEKDLKKLKEHLSALSNHNDADLQDEVIQLVPKLISEVIRLQSRVDELEGFVKFVVGSGLIGDTSLYREFPEIYNAYYKEPE